MEMAHFYQLTKSGGDHPSRHQQHWPTYPYSHHLSCGGHDPCYTYNWRARLPTFEERSSSPKRSTQSMNTTDSSGWERQAFTLLQGPVGGVCRNTLIPIILYLRTRSWSGVQMATTMVRMTTRDGYAPCMGVVERIGDLVEGR